MDLYLKSKGYDDDPEEQGTMAFKGYSWVRKVKDKAGMDRQEVVRMDLIYNQPLKWLSRLRYADKTKDTLPVIQGLMKFGKWEIHPLYRIIMDVVNNKRSFGRQPIYDANLTGNAGQMKQIYQAIEYLITESVKVTTPGTFASDFFGIGFKESDYTTSKEEEVELQQEALNKFEKALANQFGHTFVSMSNEYYGALALKRLDKEIGIRVFKMRELKPEAQPEAMKNLNRWGEATADWIVKTYKLDKKAARGGYDE